MRLLYTALWYLALPAVFLRMAWRSRRNAGYRRRWAQRLGFVAPVHEPQRPIWVHAVSVGESVAAAPLIQALHKRYPQHPILVTSTTPTGFDRVRSLFGDQVIQAQMPFDLPDAVDRFLNRTRPALAVIMETEIWPNLFRACSRRKIPIILANARLSARSAAGYRRAGAIIRDSLAAVRYVATQSAVDAERFATLQVAPSHIVVAGNLKYAVRLPRELPHEAKALRGLLGGDLIWLAASTHEGEEKQVLEAFQSVRKKHASLRLLLVPRHPDRFDAVARLCRAGGHRVSRRSDGWPEAQHADVLLGDTMGELPLFYSTADFCFVGGSLAPVGGHNLLEPAAVGCPIIIGPHTFNMQDMRRTFEGALLTVADAAQLAAAVLTLADSAQLRDHLRRAAAERLRSQSGSVDRVLALVGSVLGKPCEQATNARPADAGHHAN